MTRILPVLLLATLPLAACEEAAPPAPPAPAPAPAAVAPAPVLVQPAPVANQAPTGQPPAQPQPPAPATTGLVPTSEYVIAWKGLTRGPEDGDSDFTYPDELNLLIAQLDEGGAGELTLTHESGRFLRASHEGEGFRLEFHDPKNKLHLRRAEPVELGELAYILNAFTEGHNNAPPRRGWTPLK